MAQPVLVTGCAGFIGYHLAERLLREGHGVVGVDVINDYYDPKLKRARLARLARHTRFDMREMDLVDRQSVASLFLEMAPARIVHLAAQAGVRHSLTDPHAYIDDNITAFLNILEGCRHHGAEHLLYASSSSVYGANVEKPFSETHGVDHPVSIYAATKRANELMAHSYAHLFGVRSTGLRIFTVYGPWGRPDMALFQFTRAILAGEPIRVFNRGDMQRDFVYVDDVVEGIVRLLPHAPQPAGPSGGHDPSRSGAPFRLYNIGNNAPVELMDLIRTVERELGVPAKLELVGMQPGDVQSTWADTDRLVDAVGHQPATPLSVGIRRFIEWYRSYYG